MEARRLKKEKEEDCVRGLAKLLLFRRVRGQVPRRGAKPQSSKKVERSVGAGERTGRRVVLMKQQKR